MQGVKIYKITSNKSLGLGASATTQEFGENIPGGTIGTLVGRITGTSAAATVDGSFDNLISNLRLTLNGTVITDFRANFNSATAENAGRFGYLLQSIGGKSVEKPGSLSKEYYFELPLGVTAEAGTSRLEITMGFSAAQAAFTTSNLDLYIRYNDAVPQTTYVQPATSFTHGIGIEQVVIRRGGHPGTVAGILVQNDTAADELGTQGIRIHALGAFGLDPDLYRMLNGDLDNGVHAGVDGTSTSQLQYFQQVPGCLFIPTYQLSGGDVIAEVDSSAVTTRTYSLVITSPVNAKEADSVKQTEAVKVSTAGSILRRAEE